MIYEIICSFIHDDWLVPLADWPIILVKEYSNRTLMPKPGLNDWFAEFYILRKNKKLEHKQEFYLIQSKDSAQCTPTRSSFLNATSHRLWNAKIPRETPKYTISNSSVFHPSHRPTFFSSKINARVCIAACELVERKWLWIRSNWDMSTLSSFHRRHGSAEMRRAETNLAKPNREVAPPVVKRDGRMAADYYMTFLEYHSDLSLISSRAWVFHPLLFSVPWLSLSLSLSHTYTHTHTCTGSPFLLFFPWQATRGSPNKPKCSTSLQTI